MGHKYLRNHGPIDLFSFEVVAVAKYYAKQIVEVDYNSVNREDVLRDALNRLNYLREWLEEEDEA